MDPATARQLGHQLYEGRKSAALKVEKQVTECYSRGNHKQISRIIDQIVDMFSNPSYPYPRRAGGLTAMAATAIALGADLAPYTEKFLGPLLNCFADPEPRIRYYTAESLYNVAKTSRGNILLYMDEIFGAFNKLVEDADGSVKSGAELLDRLMKDLMSESTSIHGRQNKPEDTESTQSSQEICLDHTSDSDPGHLAPLTDSPPSAEAEELFPVVETLEASNLPAPIGGRRRRHNWLFSSAAAPPVITNIDNIARPVFDYEPKE